MFEEKVVWRISRYQKDEAAVEQKKLHNEALYNFYLSDNKHY